MNIEQARTLVTALTMKHPKFIPVGEPRIEHGLGTVDFKPFSVSQATLTGWFDSAGAILCSYGLRMTTGNMFAMWKVKAGAVMAKRYQSLEDIVSEYTTFQEVEFKSIWAQADSLALAAAEGWDIDAIKGEIATAAGCGKRTVYYRYKMGKIFPPDRRIPDIHPTKYQLCTNAVDLRTGETDFTACYEWLEKTAANNWSTRQLEAAMSAAGNDPKNKIVFLLDNEPCSLQRIVRLPLTETHEAVFNLTADQAQHLRDLPYGTPLQITLLQAPAQDESEAA